MYVLLYLEAWFEHFVACSLKLVCMIKNCKGTSDSQSASLSLSLFRVRIENPSLSA